MAFMYPAHYPTVPLRWDESAWVAASMDTQEEALLSNMETRITAQSESAQMRCVSESVCGGGLQEEEDIEEEEEDPDEDEEQNAR
uniref:UBC core domain-containing protein n=1 Tax=Ascaris lumbricoides TaxID=6252 RepID=A0A0M3IBI5_ASCLU